MMKKLKGVKIPKEDFSKDKAVEFAKCIIDELEKKGSLLAAQKLKDALEKDLHAGQ